MQDVFARPPSPWALPLDYPAALAGDAACSPLSRVDVLTRYIAPTVPDGAWRAYFDQWPFALVPEDDPLYEITDLSTSSRRGARRHPHDLRQVGPRARRRNSRRGRAGARRRRHRLLRDLDGARRRRRGPPVLVVADACAGRDADHERALDAMGLYAPLIEVVHVSDLERAAGRSDESGVAAG